MAIKAIRQEDSDEERGRAGVVVANGLRLASAWLDGKTLCARSGRRKAQPTGGNGTTDAGIDHAFFAGGRMGKLFVLLRVAGQWFGQVRQGMDRRALLREQQGEGKQQKQ
jgi:hypothetical protein